MPHIRGHNVSPNFAQIMRGQEPVGRQPAMLPGQQFIPAGVPAQSQTPLPGQPIQPGVPLAQPQTLTNLPAVQQPGFGQGGAGQAVPIQQPVAQAQGQDNTALINQTFTSILGRPPTAADIQFYQQQLAQGLSPQEFQAQVAAGGEALGRNVTPQTGLIGAEAGIQQGLGAGIAALEEGFGRAGQAVQGGTQQALGLIGQAQQPLQPFQQGGQQAQELLAAFLGAGGPQAQQQAFQNFQFDPGQEFLQREGERALTRNAAALGGIGGGNIRRDLVRFGIGTGQQALQQRIANLSGLAGQGLTAAGGIGQLGAAGAGFAQQGGLAQGNLLGQAGALASGQFQQAGRDIAQQRFQTGQDIARAVGGTTSALSALASQQGAGLADITGGGAANLANILSGAGQLDAAGQQALATILSNLATGQGTQQAILQQGIGAATAGGITGQAAGLRSGIAQAAAAASGLPTPAIGSIGTSLPI